MESLRKVADDIISLTIQGATNIAIEGVKAVVDYGNSLPSNLSEDEFIAKIKEAEQIIRKTRPTEPAMQNGLKLLEYELKRNTGNGTEMLQMAISEAAEYYISLLKSTKQQIINYGASLIQDGYTVMTHCHSSLSSETIIKAFKDGKDIRAIATETRPRYQGRKTAVELSEAGIPTTQVVDSAMRWVMRKMNVDMVIIGMDAVTSLGTVINKIGSRLLALAAKEADVPFFVSGSLLKFDSDTMFGKRTEIEERDIIEITKDWENAPKNLTILNPAFESVSRDYIDGLITEQGIFAPELVYKLVKEKYPFMVEETTL
ncbi:MAG: ribose 1,5-bisphosphate isomerase [Methanobacteriota archaeon]|nr:MAG: ribose 1,5-bisphosphate isomerase [Euryarchaeota archaeon]